MKIFFFRSKNKNGAIWTLLVLSLICFNTFAQKDYNKFYRDSDPARDSINPTTKYALHQNFLRSAIANKDTLKAILGNLYLSNDLTIQANYSSVMTHLIQAEELATLIRDTLLLGRINHKKGAVYSIFENHEKTIKYYQKALEQNRIAKDSQYIAITLEQLGSQFSNLKDYSKSNDYYEIAIPLVEKFWNSKNMIVTLINYGNSLDEQGFTEKAIQVYERAIKIGSGIEYEYETSVVKLNLAFVYMNNDSLDLALSLYKECINIFKRNAWLDFLVDAYSGISSTYEKMNEIDSSYHYLQKHYVLNDSVLGTKVQLKVDHLETEAEFFKKDTEVLIEKEKALKTQENFKKAVVAILILLTTSSIIVWYFFQKAKKEKQRLSENRQALKQLTKVLASKNAELRDLSLSINQSSKKDKLKGNDQPLDNVNYYDLTILTDQDWEKFKGIFESSYPGYIHKIRSTFPNISSAEERLFIFIKLKISTKEAANMLGVQPETIKKTRTRLKKRLKLEPVQNINEFIQNFN